MEIVMQEEYVYSSQNITKLESIYIRSGRKNNLVSNRRRNRYYD